MSLDQKQRAALEELSGKIAAELVFAEVGRDDGLIPTYSLLGELLEQVGDCEPIQRAATLAQSTLGRLLDAGQPWDAASERLLIEFSSWCEHAGAAADAGQPVPEFKPGNANSEAAAGSAETSTADAESGSTAEWLELDAIQSIDLAENRELLTEFHTEAVDHLGQIETAVLQLEGNPDDRDAINSVFRSFHSLKGGAGFLHLRPVNRLAHELESLLDDVRNGRLSLSPEIVNVVLAGRDTIEQLLEQVREALHADRQPDTPIPVSGLIARVREIARRGDPVASAASASDEAAAPIGQAQTPNSDTASVPPPTSAPPAPIPSAAGSAPSAAHAARHESNTIRVQTGKLDGLMDLVGELVIAQSQLVEGARAAGATSSLNRTVGQLARISKELQHTAMSLRMIPIKPTFQKMARLVRDIGVSAGKSVTFSMHGEETELDRNMVEEIGDPLVHMIRNAVDHGIEPPAERLAAGKPETGHISLHAYHQGGNIVVELNDDGRGIDTARVLRKAIEKGLVSSTQRFSDAEIFQFIFLPGFSTAEKITDLSGRGVGMDVVKRNIERLRGSIEISSQLGRGSTFRILLPLTMAIIDGLIVRVGTARFILPTASVQVALRPQPEMLATIQGRSEVIVVRGRTIPVVRLHRRFNIESGVDQLVDGTVVILDNAGRTCGLFVDEMVSKQEVVVKSLGGTMRNIPGISGGAILGDGSIALILDPTNLVRAA